MGQSAAKEIKLKDIKGITLLSIGEANRFPKEILSYKSWWWLRSPGYYSISAAAVRCDGSIYSNGDSVLSIRNAVRPALILNDNSINLKNGDLIRVFGKNWYYQDGLALLMDDLLLFMVFRRSWSAKDPNDYEKSDIKKYLGNWLKERMEEKQ